MSTKLFETCNDCGKQVMPDAKYVFIDQYQIGYKQWAYRCTCGKVWANEAQRIHNSEYMHRALRDRKSSIYA